MAFTTIDDGSFSTAALASPPIYSRPFVNDAGAYILEQDFLVNQSNYSPLALNTAHPTASDYRLVGELTPTHEGGGVLRVRRRYAKVPSARSQFESFAATFPAIAPAKYRVQFNLSETGTDGTVSGTPATLLTSLTSHGLSTGDPVLINFIVSDQITGTTSRVVEFQRSVFRTVLSAPSTTTFNVGRITDAGALFFFSASKGSVGRKAFTKVVNSRLDFAYYLPGVTAGITTVDDIPILLPTDFNQIEDEFEEQTDTITEYTTPSEADYRADIAAGTWVVAEASTLRYWEGNIIERITRYVQPQ